ncbi:uncharacterized protein [Henckelia pumila]|uniref:uncharacterized protein n=1 Tax=Henckelia pumila TaxID=405737 RepID=UPI003C6E5BCA
MSIKSQISKKKKRLNSGDADENERALEQIHDLEQGKVINSGGAGSCGTCIVEEYLACFAKSNKQWNEQQLKFVINFGDIVDGFCPKDQSLTAINTIVNERHRKKN